MIFGIGNDIIEIDRIERLIERYGQKFLDKIFTLAEQAYCSKYRDAPRHFAGRFAAKEAISKALGTGFRNGISWRDIEILNNREGKPIVYLSPSLFLKFERVDIHVSISHCKLFATATAVCSQME